MLALDQQAALLGQPGLEVLHAAAEDLGLGRLRDQLALQLGDAAAQVLDLVALVGQLLGGAVGVAALARRGGSRRP